MKVYVVWYLGHLDNSAHLWAIYETKEKAEEEIRKIKEEGHPHGGMKRRYSKEYPVYLDVKHLNKSIDIHIYP